MMSLSSRHERSNRGRRILLMLRVPPPVGGGEIWSVWLRDYVAGNDDFAVLEISSKWRTKTSQGAFRWFAIVDHVRTLYRVGKALRDLRPSVFLLQFPWRSDLLLRDFGFLLLAKTFGAVPAAELHGCYLECLEKRGVLHGMARHVVGSVRSVRVLGQSCRRYLEEGLGRNRAPRIVVIPNGVPDRGIRVRLDEDNCRRILFLGTLSREKGFLDLAEAVALLQRRGVIVDLFCAGAVKEQDFPSGVESFLSDLGIDSCVHLLGVVGEEEKRRLFQTCGLFVLPSYREGLPLSILEAMSVGMAVIATPVGAVVEVIDHGRNGLLAAPGRVQQLARAISELATDVQKSRILGENARRDYEQFYRLEDRLEEEVKWLRSFLREEVRCNRSRTEEQS